jgi:RNA polymerase sigma factor (sigma-70 family)
VGESFEEFVRTDWEIVRRGLVARYGVEIGSEAAAEAMRVAWERWPSLAEMSNPVGFLFRVGQSHARPHLRWARRRARLLASTPRSLAPVDPHEHDDLVDALDRLSSIQRAVVLLVRAHGYSYAETAELLDITETAVTNHVHRGTRRLRKILEAHT